MPLNNIQRLRARLDRAWHYIEDFEAGKAAFLSKNPYRVVPHEDLQGTYKRITYVAEVVEEPPIELSLIVSSCIHQLRSTLDNAVYQLGVLAKLSSKDLGHLNFPTCHEESNWLGWIARYNGLPSDAFTVIRDVQPYRTAQKFGIPTDTFDPRDSSLFVLNRLWNDDKHQTLALFGANAPMTGVDVLVGEQTRIPGSPSALFKPAGATSPSHQDYARESAITRAGGNTTEATTTSTSPVDLITVVGGAYGFDKVTARAGTFDNGSVLMSYNLVDPNAKPQIKPRFVFDLGFDIDGPAIGRTVDDVLTNLYKLVAQDVIAKFEPFFPR